MRLNRRFWLALSLLLLPQMARSTTPPAHAFRITGVAVSSRDGSPVPFCRLSANSVAGPTSTTTAPGRFGNGSGGPGFAGGFQRGGPSQRPGGRGGNSAPQNGETTADASGHFTLELPHAGDWVLTGTARGFHSQLYEQHDSYTTGIILTDDSPSYAVTFRLAPDALITGLVLDEMGEPVRLAQVMAELIPVPVPGQPKDLAPQPRQVEAGQTDDRGRYELAGLAPGSYRVRVQAQPWYSANLRGVRPANLGSGSANSSPDPSLDYVYASTWFPAATSEQDAETLRLAGGEERQADFRLVAIPSVHLEVPRADSPPQPENGRQQRQQRPATITKVSGDGFSTITSFFNGNGNAGFNWDFGGLSPGTYEIHLPGPDGQSEGEVRQFEVRPGASGMITLEGSVPLTRVTVALDGVNDEDVSMVQFVDIQTGRRLFTNQPRRGRRGPRGDHDDDDDEGGDDTRSATLPPGTYEVDVFGRSGAFLFGIDAKGAQVIGQQIKIGTTPAALTLHVADGRGELSGVAHAAADAAQEIAKPAAGAMILLVPITLGQPGDTSTVQRDQSNTDGSFHFRNLIPGKYILLAIQNGWGLDWSHADSLSTYLAHGVPIELKPTQKTSRDVTAQQP